MVAGLTHAEAEQERINVEQRTTFVRCHVCKEPTEVYDDGFPLCSACEQTYPPSLIKATADSFDYALMLRTGEMLKFTDATIHGAYATITGQHPIWEDEKDDRRFIFARGVDVRISDIVWCADAPNGS